MTNFRACAPISDKVGRNLGKLLKSGLGDSFRIPGKNPMHWPYSCIYLFNLSIINYGRNIEIT